VRNVGVQHCAEDDPPELDIVSQSWEILGLETIERAVPTQIGLLPAVVIDDEDEEHDHVGNRQPEGDGSPREAGEEDCEQARRSLGQELVWLD
jgi:hypothetical protein